MMLSSLQRYERLPKQLKVKTMELRRTPAAIAEKIDITIVDMTKQLLIFLLLHTLRPPEMKKKTEVHIPVPMTETPCLPPNSNSSTKRATCDPKAISPQMIWSTPITCTDLDLYTLAKDALVDDLSMM